MTTEAMIGHGTIFSIRNTDSPSTYDPIAEVTGVKPPKLSRDTVDATHNLSPEKWREFIAGLKDAGEVSFDINFIPGNSSTTRLLDSFNSDVPLSCKIAFPDSPSTEWTFDAYCTGFEADAPLDDKMSASVTLKVTGKPTFVES